MSNNTFNIAKLTGRDNYASWKFAMKAYLEHEDLWQCIEKDAKEVDANKDVKAKSKLILLVDPINYVHIQDAKTCKEVWTSLERAFDDNGLTRKVALLKDLITTTLESSRSVEDYVNKIMTTAHKLRNIGFNVDDEWLGTLMLAGLPDMYKPMIMGIESSSAKISADMIKTKLLQEVQSSESTAFYTNQKKSYKKQNDLKQKGPRCFNCNKYGHMAKNCRLPKKIPNNKNEDKSFAAAFSVFSAGMDQDSWYVDSGASMHMTNRSDWMYDVKRPPISTITVASKTPLPVVSAGNVNLILNDHNNSKVQVTDVLYIPKLAANLLSVSAMVKNGCKVNFNDNGCEIYNCKGDFVCSATLVNNLYLLNTHREVTANLTTSDISNDVVLWHRRMGHLNFSDVNKLPDCTEGVKLSSERNRVPAACTTCLEGKQSRLPFNNVGSRASDQLELIHSDLCGPMETLSLGGMRYFITFIDDYTRKVHVYFLKDKLSVLDVFKDFHKRVENEFNGKKIKVLRTDNGKEFCNKHFDNYLNLHGIKHQTSTPYSPQQNGLAERMNRTLVERAKCMLFDANLPKQFWAEATATAAYIINRSPTHAIGEMTPQEMWTGKKPVISHMKIFGSEVMTQIPKEKRQKWDRKSKKFIFVGYCESTKGYRLADPKTYKIIKSRDVVFLENLHKFDNIYVPCNVDSTSCIKPETPLVESAKEQSQSERPSLGSTEEPSGIRNIDTSSSIGSSEYETDTGDDTYTPDRVSDTDIPERHITLRPRNRFGKASPSNIKFSYLCPTSNLSDPQTVEEALSSVHADQWRSAMDEEYDSLKKNKTWTLTELPQGKKALPCKWVFKTKTDEKGEITRFKARLVIKGYAQKRGVDYNEIYSPVVRYTSVRYLIALAAKYDLDIEQMDAITAFLQGDIDSEIYMRQPPLYENGMMVCKLNKSIYGLKQASRQWNIKLDNVLQETGLKRSKIDPCIYYHVNQCIMIFIAVWVDDLIIFSNNNAMKTEIKSRLQDKFNMKDLGEVGQCIGINITRIREKNVIMIDQEKYIREVLERFGMFECKPVRTPIEVNIKFDQNKEEENEDIPYRQAVGCLLYLAHVTRPDIAYATNKLSRYGHNPTDQHWLGVKRVMRYLQGTKDQKLCFTKEESEEIIGYCDADWASNPEDRRSCTGFTFLFQNGSIAWNSCKQQTVALSTAEAEYMAMASAAQEALWLRQLQTELGQRVNKALVIYCDNQSAIQLASTDCFKPRTKHIDIRLFSQR